MSEGQRQEGNSSLAPTPPPPSEAVPSQFPEASPAQLPVSWTATLRPTGSPCRPPASPAPPPFKRKSPPFAPSTRAFPEAHGPSSRKHWGLSPLGKKSLGLNATSSGSVRPRLSPGGLRGRRKAGAERRPVLGDYFARVLSLREGCCREFTAEFLSPPSTLPSLLLLCPHIPSHTLLFNLGLGRACVALLTQ